MSVPVTPAEFLAGFSFRFVGGEESDIVPFVEFGHHVCRVKFSSEGTFILVDHETLKVAESDDFKYVPGEWYHALAELKGDEFVVQFVDGPACTSSMNAWRRRTPAVATGLVLPGQRMERLS